MHTSSDLSEGYHLGTHKRNLVCEGKYQQNYAQYKHLVLNDVLYMNGLCS